MLILGSARSHLRDIAKSSIKENLKLAVILGRLTKYLKPLDILVNQSFKDHLRAKQEDWMVNTAYHTYTRGGRLRHAIYSEICQWVLDSFNAVTSQCIINNFVKSF